MKVAFDARPTSEANGVGRYSRCLLKALRETAPPGAELIEMSRPSALGRSRGADVLHAPWIDGAMLHSPCPMVVSVHNLAALKRRSEQLRAGGVRLRLRRLALQRAACVVVPSEAVARDAVTELGVERERVSVIPEAADVAMYARGEREVAAVRERFGLPERYLVWVGCLEQPEPVRQLARLAAAPHELPLVLVGPSRPWAQELPGVILTGRVTDEQLAAIYSGAHALIVPSDDEGFGLPAVEALACGTPVVACASPALQEMLGGRATLVEPGDMKGLLAAAVGARRPAPTASAWSWQDTARATWQAYEHARAFGARDGGGTVTRRRRPPAPRLDGLEPR